MVAEERGDYAAAIDVFEALADRGFVHPDASYDRGLAYALRARAMERLGQCIAQQRLWCSQRRSTYLTMNAALSQQLRAAQEEVDNADFTTFDDMIGELQRLEDELKKPDPQI